MKSTYYKGYELQPTKYKDSLPGGTRYQMQVFKDGAVSFHTSYCYNLQQARAEAKEIIKSFNETTPPAFQVRPILFSTEMVQALKEGRKFQTRRIVKGLALEWLRDCGFTSEFVADPANNMCLYGEKGDVLYVRETFSRVQDKFGNQAVLYRADQDPDPDSNLDRLHIWKPNIFMPKKLARLWLRITDVRIETLQAITEQDAIAEGVEPVVDNSPFDGPIRWFDYMQPDSMPFDHARGSFQSLISKIHGPELWNADPWVWVIEFEILLDLTKTLPAGMTFDPETLILQFTTGDKTVSECLK